MAICLETNSEQPQFEADYKTMIDWCQDCLVWLRIGQKFNSEGDIEEDDHGLFTPISKDPFHAVNQLQQRLMTLRAQGLSYVLDRAKKAGAIRLPEEKFKKALVQLFDEHTERLFDLLRSDWRRTETGENHSHAPVRLADLVRLIFPDCDPENSNRYRQKIKRDMLLPFTALGIWNYRQGTDGFSIWTADLLECFEENVFLPIASEMIHQTSDQLRFGKGSNQ